MEEIKEVQQSILPEKKDNPINEKVTDEEFFAILKLISPGTGLRTALEGIVQAGKGAIIAAENENLFAIIDGGFKINAKFSPQKIVELSKMDGAIILSNDLKRINSVNVLLSPTMKIKTSETGTRHKAAERTAKQTAGLVIAISERRKEITIYYKNRRHVLKSTSEILRRVSENIQILEKQRESFDRHLDYLTKIELKNYAGINSAIKAIQKGQVIQKISAGIKKDFIELGNEGTILKIRLGEILADVEKETNLVIKDYANINYKKAIAILYTLTYEELLDKNKILDALNWSGQIINLEVRGWRLLSKTSLRESEIALLMKEFGGLQNIIKSDLSTILEDEIAKKVRAELDRIKSEH